MEDVRLNSIEEAVEDFKEGKFVIVVDDEDRENEGDLIIAAEKIDADKVNFMLKHARGVLCAPITISRCDELDLPHQVSENTSMLGTPFTVTVDKLEGCSTGVSAHDRAETIKALADPNSTSKTFGRPGHINPLYAQDNGVLRRSGHTEAAIDLCKMAGLYPAGALMEIMNEDGTMARLPDLQIFAAQHNLKIGTIADLIEHRSRTESLVEKVGSRTIQTAAGEFTAHAYRDKPSNEVHLALVKGPWSADDTVAVRVHEPLSVLDALEVNRTMHSWSLDASLRHIAAAGKGVAVLLNCGESGAELLAQFEGTARAAQAPTRGRMDLRTYGIGAQILRELGVHRMQLMGTPRRMPSMAGYGLEITGYLTKE